MKIYEYLDLILKSAILVILVLIWGSMWRTGVKLWAQKCIGTQKMMMWFSGACDYAKYTEDDPMCQQCAIGFISDLRAYKLSSDHKFKSKYKNLVKEF